jgi:hypothetical protein
MNMDYVITEVKIEAKTKTAEEIEREKQESNPEDDRNPG